MEIIVTRKSNIEQDSEGNFLLNSEGDPIVIDEKSLGIYTKTHCLQVNQLDPKTHTIQTGVIFRSEVFWNDVRSPAPAMEDPTDLVWLTIGEEADETNDDQSDYDDDEEQEEMSLS